MSEVLTAIQSIFKWRQDFPFQPGIQSTSSVQKLVLQSQCWKFRLRYFKENLFYRVNGFPGQTRRPCHPVEPCISAGKWTLNTSRALHFLHRHPSRRKAGPCDEDREGPSRGRLTGRAPHISTAKLPRRLVRTHQIPRTACPEFSTGKKSFLSILM